MKLHRMLRGLASPPSAVLVPVLLSFLAWRVPDFGVLRKGFETPQPIFGAGGLMVCVWYGTIILCALFGEYLGRTMAPAGRHAQATVGLDDVVTYRLVSLIGALGAGYAFAYAASLVGFGEIANLVSAGQANQLKQALYEDYSIGLLSLRYVVILSGGLAIYHLITGLSRGLWEIGNLAALFAVTLISSRLSLIAALFTASMLFLRNNPPVRIPWGRIVLGAAALFALLSFFNMSRNKTFYENRFAGGFAVSGVSEMVTYLGSPFQGCLAAGNYFGPIARGMDADSYTDIEIGLATNSAFIELLEDHGAWCFLWIGLTSFGAALLIGLLHHHFSTHFGLASCVLLYCYAEIWRIFLFGMLMFLIGESILVLPGKLSSDETLPKRGVAA